MGQQLAKCVECGEANDVPFAAKPELCLTCGHWLEIIEQLDERSIRIEGKHFRAGPADVPPKYAGFGGQLFRIAMDDGRTIETRNLWFQGSIPERFRDQLPNNARFVTDAEPKRAAA